MREEIRLDKRKCFSPGLGGLADLKWKMIRGKTHSLSST